MENNIENNIKKAFRNREIQPSVNAWKILEAKLDTAETKRKSIFFKYLAYASIFVGLLLGLYVFINPSKTKKTQKELITKETPKLKFENQQLKSEIASIPTKKETTTPQKNNTKQIVVKIEKKKPKKRVKKEGFFIKNSEKTKPIVFKKLEKVVEEENKIPIMEKQNSISINDTNKKIVVKATDKKTKKKIVTSDAELNQLLTRAVNLEMAKKDTAKPTINIKTNQLLYSLENEINKPIKTKLLDKLLKATRTVDTYLSRNKN